MKFCLSIFCLLWLLVFSVPCLAKDWNNIFPLKTTRAEVIQMLGSPNQSNEGEYFEIDNQRVIFRWTRPDCYGENSIIEKQPVSLDALVFQITVEPKDPKDERYINIRNELNSKPSDSSDSKDIKTVYKKWISNDVNCLIDANGSSCSITNDEKGFGYSTSNDEITRIYYFPTEKELKTREETHQPCKAKEENPDSNQ